LPARAPLGFGSGALVVVTETIDINEGDTTMSIARNLVAGALVVAAVAVSLAVSVPTGAATRHRQVTTNCRNAITDYRLVAGIASEAIGDGGQYAAELQPAAVAGADQSTTELDLVIAKVQTITASVDSLESQLQIVIPELRRTSSGCLAGN
jgi:hypothetical protein